MNQKRQAPHSPTDAASPGRLAHSAHCEELRRLIGCKLHAPRHHAGPHAETVLRGGEHGGANHHSRYPKQEMWFHHCGPGLLCELSFCRKTAQGTRVSFIFSRGLVLAGTKYRPTALTAGVGFGARWAMIVPVPGGPPMLQRMFG